MKKEKVYLILTTIFVLLTLVVVAYILAKEGEINAGYALIPCLFSIIFSQLCVMEKNKNKKINENQMKKHKKITTIIIVIIIIFIILNFVSILNLENKPKNNYESFIEVNQNNKQEITKELIVNNEQGSYTIYYYGIDSAMINLNNQTYDLADAIFENKITIEELIKELEIYGELNDGGTTIFYDGGTKKYLTDNYIIIKCHTLDGNRDIYIGNKDMEYEESFCK